MSQDAPALRIPVVLDKSQAKADLKGLEAATRQQAAAAVKDQQQANQQATRSDKDAARDRQKTAKEAADYIAKVNADLAAKVKAKADETAKQQGDAARRTAKDSKDAADASFRAWKQGMDAQHRQAMQAWTEQQAAGKRNKESLLGQVTSVEALGQAFMKLSVVKEIAGFIREAMQNVGESIKDAREHIKGLTTEMEGARKESRELAALRGRQPTAMFTAEVAREAASVGLSPEQYQESSLAFEAHAGQFVGAEGATPEQLAKGGKKLSKEQALDLQKRIAAFGVGARGQGGDETMRLLGTVIAKSKTGATNDDYVRDFAKIMKVAELAPGHTSPQVAQIAELGMESAGEGGDVKSLLQAAYISRIMSQRNPAEASTYGRAMFRGLREVKYGEDSKSVKAREELGIKKENDVFQDLEAIDEALKKRAAAGENENQVISQYFPEIREFGGFRTAINEGIRGGGFKRTMAEAASVNAETARKATGDYLNSEEGRAARDRSEETAISRERSAKYVELRHLQSEARKAQVASGQMEMPEGGIEAYMTKGGAAFGMGSRQEQEERAEVGRMLRERLLMSREGQRYLIGQDTEAARLEEKFPSPNDAEQRRRAEFASRGMFDRATPEDRLAEVANILKRIHESQEKTREAQEKAKNAPLVNMPAPQGR